MLTFHEKKENKKICPVICETGECIHLNHFDKCVGCYSSLAARKRHKFEKILYTKCIEPCRSFDCPRDIHSPCPSKRLKKIDEKECPNICYDAECLKKANPYAEIPRELMTCFCSSDRLEEFSKGPVNTVGYKVGKIARIQSDKQLSRAQSRVIEKNLGVYEIILREPVCERHSGWKKKYLERKYVNGTFYKGTVNELGFAGQGILRMPHGAVYNGEFKEGTYHGHGTLSYPTGLNIEGFWEKGKNVAIQNIRFHDGLKFLQPEWKYLQKQDRRFYPEYSAGLQPECSLYRTGIFPSPHLASNTYDTGDGYYQPKAKSVMDHGNKEPTRVPQLSEVEWIKKNCRYGWRQTIGNENMNENIRKIIIKF